jgi:acetoin utilization deacetylase AcuC-like enzyme
MEAWKMNAIPIAYALVASPEHDLGSHPENHARFAHLLSTLQENVPGKLLHVEAGLASPEELSAVHPIGYLQALKEACAEGPGYVDYAPTYVTTGSFEAARAAAGGTLAVLEAVVGGRAASGLALIRPPGHHATPTRAMGFCLLNNIALAARRAQALGLRRVMIVDFDVHHGNGTQAATEADPDILYLSTHQWGIYPGSGAIDDLGPGEGRGSVYNIPLPGGAGDAAFAGIAERVIEPAAKRFRPEILLVSAGFDAHWRDPLAGLQLTIAGYHALGRALAAIAREHCEGRIVYVLEGGYDPEVLAHGVSAIALSLAGEPFLTDPLGSAPRPEPEVDSVLERVCVSHGL